MENVKLVAIDLAKNIYQICGGNGREKIYFNKRLSRKKLDELICQLPLRWLSDKTESANYLTVSKTIKFVGNSLWLGLYAYIATQKNLLSISASIASGLFAEKAVCLTANYVGIKPDKFRTKPGNHASQKIQ